MIRPVPRPPRRPKKPRAWNSSLPVAERVVPRDSAAKKQLARKALPKTNAARRRKEWARAYGSKERVAWVKQQPCVASGNGCTTVMDNAHIRVDGMRRKADYWFVVPMCRRHHSLFHDFGAREFEAIYGVNLVETAAEIARQWILHAAGVPPKKTAMKLLESGRKAR